MMAKKRTETNATASRPDSGTGPVAVEEAPPSPGHWTDDGFGCRRSKDPESPPTEPEPVSVEEATPSPGGTEWEKRLGFGIGLDPENEEGLYLDSASVGHVDEDRPPSSESEEHFDEGHPGTVGKYSFSWTQKNVFFVKNVQKSNNKKNIFLNIF